MPTKKIAITTDSNSGILPEELKDKDVFVLPMPFLADGVSYFENINLTQEEFYKLLANDADVSTSQPSVGNLTDFWTEILKDFDEIVHIPMSSGLSQSCETATMFAKDFDGRIFVVDNHRVSIMLKESVFDAIRLRERGKSGEEIKTELENALDSTFYISVATMKYLKKGGRVTPAAATLAKLLNIKPVLRCTGEKIGKYALVHNQKKAKESMIDAVKNDFATKYADYVARGEIVLSVAHTNNVEEAEIFMEEIKAAFPNIPVHFCDPLSLSVSCHIGAGALAVGISRIIK
jgi:DegV family protein with EDD domain